MALYLIWFFSLGPQNKTYLWVVYKLYPLQIESNRAILNSSQWSDLSQLRNSDILPKEEGGKKNQHSNPPNSLLLWKRWGGLLRLKVTKYLGSWENVGLSSIAKAWRLSLPGLPGHLALQRNAGQNPSRRYKETRHILIFIYQSSANHPSKLDEPTRAKRTF